MLKQTCLRAQPKKRGVDMSENDENHKKELQALLELAKNSTAEQLA